VHRHSRAASAEIKVEADAEEVTIEIRDHGKGMPQQVLEQIDDGSKLGVGLAGMRERIRELAGEFEVASDENGTTVRATVPLSGREEGDQVSAVLERREPDRRDPDRRDLDKREPDRREEDHEERIANAFWRPRGGVPKS